MSSPINAESLWSLKAGESATISALLGDSNGVESDDPRTQRLMDIGFREGQHVTCVVCPGFGAPRVFAVGGATYSLDRDTASRVTVTREAAS